MSTARKPGGQTRNGSAAADGRGAPRVPDFDLSLDEIRAVTAFAVSAASTVLPLFEADRSADERPRAAIEAARAFADGQPRSQVLRITAPASHRAAKDAGGAPAFHAAMAAGDAAASAFLHPLADAVQIRHILRATAHTIHAIELAGTGTESRVALLDRFAAAASPTVAEVLRHYPRPGPGRSPLALTIGELDTRVRDQVALTSSQGLAR